MLLLLLPLCCCCDIQIIGGRSDNGIATKFVLAVVVVGADAGVLVATVFVVLFSNVVAYKECKCCWCWIWWCGICNNCVSILILLLLFILSLLLLLLILLLLLLLLLFVVVVMVAVVVVRMSCVLGESEKKQRKFKIYSQIIVFSVKIKSL